MRHVDFYEKAHSRSYLINVWWRWGEETSELVVLSSYEIEETAPYREESIARLGGVGVGGTEKSRTYSFTYFTCRARNKPLR